MLRDAKTSKHNLFSFTCAESSCEREFFSIDVCRSADTSGFLVMYCPLLVMHLDTGAIVTVFLLAFLSLYESLAPWLDEDCVRSLSPDAEARL